MAIYYARKNGNVNAADVWATTPTGTAGDFFSSFTSSDILMSNSFTITLNINTTVAEIRNDTTGGATAGGSFSLSNNVTLTANIIAGSVTCVTLTGSASATIIGNINGGSTNSGLAVACGTSGTLTIIGQLVGGTAIQAYALYFDGSGTITITGNIIGGFGNAAAGLHMQTVATVIVVGNIIASTNSFGIRNWAGGTFTITGTVIGSNTSTSAGAFNNGIGTINVIGTCVGGNGGGPGVSNSSTGTVTITRAKGGAIAGAGVGVAASTGGISNVEEIEFGDLGASPTSGPIRLIDKTTNVAVMYRYLSTKKTLTDVSSTSLLPSTNNVRSGIIYNNGGSTGTCAIPNANSVVYGVPVDNTIGTAIISPGAFWDILTSSIGTSGSIGERLKNCSTVATVGKQLEGVL